MEKPGFVTLRVERASGRAGTVLRTVDGGAHWQAIKVPGAGELDFRDVEGFDADTAVVLSIGPGASSRVYRTVDGGANWTLALQNDDERWALQAGGMPPAAVDEAAFAASGTCIATTPWDRRVVVTGGGAARILIDQAGSPAWTAHATPVPARVPAAGIFSAAPVGGDMLLVGGDFEHEASGSAALVVPGEEGRLQVSRLPDPNGYRSGAACVGEAQPRCIAVGPNGVDLLANGRWQSLSTIGYDAVDLAGNVGWASGDGGRITRIEIPAPSP